MSVICVYSCDTTELLASVVLQSLRVHKTMRSAALLIQSLAGGMRPQSALLVLSLLLLILIYSEYRAVAHWLVLSDSDASQLRRLSTSARRGWDQWSTERKMGWHERLDMRRARGNEIGSMCLCLFSCGEKTVLIWTLSGLLFHVCNWVKCTFPVGDRIIFRDI